VDLVIQSLVEQFKADHDLGHLAEDEAFEAFAGYCVLSSFYEDDFNPGIFRMGGGNDLGIDVCGILINGELLRDSSDVRAVTEQAPKLEAHIIVVQAKTSQKFETRVISDLAENLMHVVNPGAMPYPASADVDNLRECIQSIYANIAKLSGGLPKLHIRYVTTGEQVADMVDKKARSAERQLSGHHRFETVDFRCVTQHELRELYKRAAEAVPATFEMPKKITLPKMPGVKQALLGLLPATTLVDHVLTDPNGSIRKSLFYDNVRDFLDYNDVNREISETLRDPVHNKQFAVLNNGITIVTRNLTVVGDEIHIRDFQIVNGCQTCHVLFDERERFTDAVHVNLRLVHSQDEDVIGGIVAATNRQTAVSEEDLSAREQFHKDLEAYFEAQPSPRHLYYERRSKQYSSRQDVVKSRVITRSQLTKAYLAMFLDEAARIGHFKALVDTRKDDLFNTSQHLAAYFAAAAAYYRLEALFRTGRIPRKYSPARYHLLSAMKMRLLGRDALPQSPKKVVERCDKILNVVWDPWKSERLIEELLPCFKKAMDAELAAGVPVGEMVRTRRFAEAVEREVLGA
jgi:hypothetical protein